MTIMEIPMNVEDGEHEVGWNNNWNLKGGVLEICLKDVLSRIEESVSNSSFWISMLLSSCDIM